MRRTPFISLGDFEAVADLREDMVESISLGSAQIVHLDFKVLTAQSKWQDARKLLDELPPQVRAAPTALYGYMIVYMFTEDFQKAHEYMIKHRPYIADREHWQQEFTDRERFGCDLAGILIGAGREALGQDLLRLFIRNFESPPSGEQSESTQSREVMVCYLLEGSFEKALDILDRETTQGHLIDEWSHWGALPWWKQLEDNPRYITLVNRIETMLAEQRELLSEME